ncbi:MAG: DUF5040 domain-containing protein [Bacteroidales bacterium]|jgi:hypothetical protein|nr:DUF5040 domain-containing protein [Bacteroidales bacterium]
MKNVILFLCIVRFCPLFAQPDQPKYTILLTGASFASPANKWFEMGCAALNARAINRAIGGEAIANTANRMIDGTLYSAQELEIMDALVIMQVHNRDVFDEAQLSENYEDYKTPFDRSGYAAAFDYVIKRYMSECYELRNNPASRYYGSKAGKPAVIVLCTDWHDARVTYNMSVRRLAGKWGLPLVEFDKYIGFSKNNPHPATKEQYSLIYATDTQTVDSVKYGWHPLRGEDSFIQQRMAAIFSDLMKRILPVR